jgi:hypothetical protein
MKRIDSAMFTMLSEMEMLNCKGGAIGGERTLIACRTPTDATDQYPCGDEKVEYEYDGTWAGKESPDAETFPIDCMAIKASAVTIAK